MAMAEPLSIAAARGSSRDIVREIARSIRPPGAAIKIWALCMHLLDEACFSRRVSVIEVIVTHRAVRMRSVNLVVEVEIGGIWGRGFFSNC